MNKGMREEYIPGLVSVITPVFNSEKYISKTIESVMNQTYKNIQLVLVDDQSSDSSADIIKEYQTRFDNIVYYLQPTNLGAGAARNKALELAEGQYVAFLDSDDMWDAEKVEKQISLMMAKNTPFSYTAIEMVDDSDTVIKSKRSLSEKCTYKYLLHNTIIATSSVIVDRKVLGDFRMPLRRGGQDYATWLMLLRDNVVAYGINEAYTKYRVGHSSLSSNKFKSIKQVWEIQTQDERINPFCAGFNVCCFAINALKKYLL